MLARAPWLALRCLLLAVALVIRCIPPGKVAERARGSKGDTGKDSYNQEIGGGLPGAVLRMEKKSLGFVVVTGPLTLSPLQQIRPSVTRDYKLGVLCWCGCFFCCLVFLHFR